MPSLKNLKNRIGSVKSTQQITRAMKMVAASKLRRAQDRLMQMRPYANKLNQILTNVSANLSEETVSDYATERDTRNVLLVVISSDKGLCGAFNASIFRYAKQLIANEYSFYERNERLYIMPIGTKAYDHFSKRGYQVVDDHAHLFSEHDFEHAREAAEYIMHSFTRGEFDRVVLVYNEFKNVATQIPVADPFLPIKKEQEEPAKETPQNAQNDRIDYIYEPSEEYIVDELIPQSLKIQFYRATLESAAAEQGSRMTAMDQATDNAGELLKQLRLTYNRTRQAAITTEILEIVAGAEALK